MNYANLNETPRANRLHIGIFGRRNSGKSSLINAITGHNIALVSDYAGTTADPVFKTMEIHPIGPCVLIDTAGFDDEGEIGLLRVSKTREAAQKTDIALIVFGPDDDMELEKSWIEEFKKNKTPVITVLNKSDIIEDTETISKNIEKSTGIRPVVVSSLTREGIKNIYNAIMRKLPEDYDAKTITGGVVNEGDTVLLVMPQDIQAPKGRLILPQVQTTRELLDRKCIVVSVTFENLDKALQTMKNPPDVIITDSQVFKEVYEKKPAGSKLTSFSVLYAGYKGDIDYYVKSASAIDRLKEGSRVLIAEACTHAPLTEDIGRVKIPAMLRKRVGPGLRVDVVSGVDFPEELSGYDLIIHCGGCMFNRRYVLSRVEKARAAHVPMSNYGVVIAYLAGILDRIDLPPSSPA